MEPTSAIYPITPPPLWNLNQRKPTSIQPILKALEFFKEHPEWIEKNQKESSRYFFLLDQTQLSSNQLSDIAWKTYATLFMKFPDLFPSPSMDTEKVILGSTQHGETEVCKNHLLMLSDKFRKELSGMMKEGKSDKIEINTHRYDSGVVQAFLAFIQSGNLILTDDDNVIQLLCLADEHHIEILTEECLICIKNNLEIPLLPDLLQTGLDQNLPDLTWLCLSFGIENGQMLQDLDINQCSKEVKELICGLKELANLTTPPKFGEAPGEILFKSYSKGISHLASLNQYIPISLKIHDTMNNDEFAEIPHQCPLVQKLSVNLETFNFNKGLEVLKKLKNLKDFNNGHRNFLFSFEDVKAYVDHVSVSSLDLTRVPDITDEDLIELEKKVPNLKELSIWSDKITTIPFKKLEQLNCANCNSLQTLSLPFVKKLGCHNCPALTSISAPLVEDIFCAFCQTLTTLSIPCALKIDCSHCLKLTTLVAPLAEIVECDFCNELTSLSAQQAHTISCSHCNALTFVSAPHAKTVKCSNHKDIKWDVPASCNFSN